MVAALCHVASSKSRIQAIQQGTDCCTILTTIPSGFRTLSEGDFAITITKKGVGTTAVDAKTKIPGQLYDMGKSKEAINSLFTDIATELTKM